ncbi:hypothetical protein DSO57_1003009 [Entomophthora muscae]|uniref:Uncharacterized protein n=1 Tax=Entomophthora muscae TaxID=34485 RepID=A0ACC2SXM4_9FUNG|nr:hypothetical protein DSO57_1003009 [Entomophthora muscae]
MLPKKGPAASLNLTKQEDVVKKKSTDAALEIDPFPKNRANYSLNFPPTMLRLRITHFFLLPRVELLINLLVFADWLILALIKFERSEDDEVYTTFFGDEVTWPYQLRHVLNGLFLVELLFKTYAYGLVFSPYRIVPEIKSYSKSHSGVSYTQAFSNDGSSPPPDLLFNIIGSIDLISVLAFWAYAILSVSMAKEQGWTGASLLVVLSALRPWRLLSLFPKFPTITKSIFNSLPLLGNLAFFFACFSLLFATLGLVLFKGHGSSQCTSDSEIIWPKYSCRGHYTSESHSKVDLLRIGGVDFVESFPSGYICVYPYKCVVQPTEYSFINFDTIFTSMLSVYIVSSVESWAEIMYRIMSTVSPWASVFFVSCVMILNYCLVALFVAVIASIFEKIREEKEAASRLETKAYAPTPLVEEGFEFVQPPHEPNHSRDPNSNAALKGRLGRLESAILKTLPMLDMFALVLIGVDLMARTYHVRRITEYSHVYFPINGLLFIESAFQLLRLRQPKLLRVSNPNIPHAISTRWVCIGICLQFILCFASLVISYNPQKFSARTGELLNIFPILRFYRLPLSIPRIQNMFWLLAARVSGMVSLMGFILASILLIAPISMQLICLSLDDPQNADEVFVYFGSLRFTMLSLFQIFTGEDWPDLMKDIAILSHQRSQVIIILFFVLWSGFSNLILLNLFIAQTMECFELPESRKHHSQIMTFVNCATKASAHQQKNPIGALNPYRYLNPSPMLISPPGFPKPLLLRIPHYLVDSFLRFVNENSNIAETHTMTERDYLSAEFKHSHPMYDTSWFIFRPDHPIRRLCQELTEPNYRGYSLGFNLVVWAAVLAAVGMALFNTPQFRRDMMFQSQEHILLWINPVLATFFLVEFAVRTIAHGFLLTPNAYLKHPWYVVEFVVLVVFLVDVGLSLSPESYISQVVCGLKALRALRLMSLVPKVKDTIYGVFIAGFPRILDVSLLLMSLIVPCAFYGYLLFFKQGLSCSDDSIPHSSGCFGEFRDPTNGILMPRVWNNYGKFSFESMGSSMLVLFEILSGEKWVEVVDQVMTFASEDFSQGNDLSWWYCLYFVFYYIVGSIIVMSMFVAVIIENYRRYTGAACLTSNQRHWIDLRKQLLQATPSLRPTHDTMPLQQWCRRWTTAKDGAWSNILSVAHFLLLLCLITEFNGQDWDFSDTKRFLRALLLLISFADHMIRILGLGMKTLLHSRWNSAHALVTALALIVTLFSIFSERNILLYDLSNILSLVVSLKLMFRFNRLSELAKMAAASLPNILMTLYAWCVLLITYSILFMQIFGLTRHGENGSDVESFRTFGYTFLMLFRMTTGEGWNNFMHDYTVNAPFCVYSPNYLHSDCGSPALAYILFLSFNVLSMFIFTNLFVIIVIDSFNYCRDAAASFTLLTRSDIRHFKHTWSLFDRHARGYIPCRSLVPFILALESPFDMSFIDSTFSVKALMKSYAALGPVDPSNHLAYAQWLDGRLAQMPRHLAQRRRHFNIFYHHAMSMEEPGKGLFFTDIILLLSKYKLIDPDQCLAIPDILQFKKVEKQVYRTYYTEKALGICRTWILRRNFLKKLELRHASQAPPIIFVNVEPQSSGGHTDIQTGSHSFYSTPLHSPAMSTSSSWFVPPIATVMASSPCSESFDSEDRDPQDILTSLAQSPWAACLRNEIQSYEGAH